MANHRSNSSHAISRNQELLSCARTAQKLLRQQQQRESANDDGATLSVTVKPPPMTLWKSNHSNEAQNPYLEDGMEALDATERAVAELESLVKRRGHIQNPTEQIEECMTEFKTCMEELMSSARRVRTDGPLCSSSSSNGVSGIIRRKRVPAQRKKHFDIIASVLEQKAKGMTERFQKALSIRSDVLKLQAQRKRMLTTTNPNSKSFQEVGRPVCSSAAATATNIDVRQFDSPLFTMTGSQGINARTETDSAATTFSSAGNKAAPLYNNSGSSQNVPVGQTFLPAAQTGMRQRKGVKSQPYSKGRPPSSSYHYYQQAARNNSSSVNFSNNDNGSTASAYAVQEQIQQRRNERDTKSRLENANQVEAAIAELGQMFGKMASLVSQQQEIVEKIEDDVESSLIQVDAGTEEIQKVFNIVQGNRTLILKIFALLTFFILFFRLY